ncbi:MAG: hypothetical protein KGQ83_06795, partial [Planctomycetes bacterium]|nr:hypothetical protein [Planctomycetota bacterium]
RNEICVIGLPRCDFVFSSTRTCFIAFGYEESPLEMTILRKLIQERGIQAVEASGSLAPAQNAFCAKICSKIITSQFCIVLINNEEKDGREIPNANVNMEYGLMLGFNKYVIPFQRAVQKLPFNVAGLDTIKYNNRDFERLAATAIDQAIETTRQESISPLGANQITEVFLLTKKALITPLNNEGDKNIYQLGAPLGFNLLNDFSGMNYMYFGNFTALRPETVLWRLRMLTEILDGRRATLKDRVKVGVATEEQVQLLEELLQRLEIWLVVTSNEEKTVLNKVLNTSSQHYKTQVFSIGDVWNELENLGKA